MLFKVDLITYRGVYRTVETEKLNIPTSEGRRTILSNHMPIMIPITVGVIETANKNELSHYAINSGVLYYTDEQVARAIEAICGEGKPLDTKVKWAAVYWYLRWQCNYPVKGSEFCERIASLPFTKKLDPECCYNNIRKLVTLSFMNQDARQLDSVKPSRSDEADFRQCRAVVRSLAEALAKLN